MDGVLQLLLGQYQAVFMEEDCQQLLRTFPLILDCQDNEVVDKQEAFLRKRSLGKGSGGEGGRGYV